MMGKSFPASCRTCDAMFSADISLSSCPTSSAQGMRFSYWASVSHVTTSIPFVRCTGVMPPSCRYPAICLARLSSVSAISTVCPVGSGCSFGLGGAAVSGMDTKKRLPLPSSLSTVMLPPMRSKRLFTIDMPRPVPSILLMAAVLTRSKGTKICSKNAGLIPMPLSSHRKSSV